jgi:hypothetical protein
VANLSIFVPKMAKENPLKSQKKSSFSKKKSPNLRKFATKKQKLRR